MGALRELMLASERAIKRECDFLQQRCAGGDLRGFKPNRTELRLEIQSLKDPAIREAANPAISAIVSKQEIDAVCDAVYDLLNWDRMLCGQLEADWLERRLDENMEKVMVSLNAIRPAADSTVLQGDSTKSSVKKKRGGQRTTDPTADRRIADAWKAGTFRTHSELAREFNLDLAEVKRALDRERKRRNE